MKKFKESNYTPELTTEKNLRYDCPVSHILDTDHYRIDIDQDPCNAVVYLNIGYDDLTDYDSPIYLSAMDAIDVANKLLEYATIALSNETKGSYTRLFTQELLSQLENNNVSWLSVYPVSIANQDDFIGCMILDVKYYTRSDNTKHFARILSCNFLKERNKLFDDNLITYIQDTFKVDKVKLFVNQFDKLYKSIADKFTTDTSNQQKEEIMDNAFDELKEYIKNNYKSPEEDIFE